MFRSWEPESSDRYPSECKKSEARMLGDGIAELPPDLPPTQALVALSLRAVHESLVHVAPGSLSAALAETQNGLGEGLERRRLRRKC